MTSHSTIFINNRSQPTVSHTVLECYISDIYGVRQHICAHIDCSMTSIFMAPTLLGRLAQPPEPRHIAPIGWDMQLMSAKENWNITIMSWDTEH